MKRPTTDVAFAPVSSTPAQVFGQLHDLLVTKLDGSLSTYFSALAFDDEDLEYLDTSESLDLTGISDLTGRASAAQACMCCFRAPFRFANGDVYAACWQEAGIGSSLFLEIDPQITRFVEDDESLRPMLVGTLASIADAIGSQFFMAGAHGVRRSLNEDQVLHLSPRPGARSIIAWKQDALSTEQVIRAYNLPPNQVRAIFPGYWFISRYQAQPAS